MHFQWAVRFRRWLSCNSALPTCGFFFLRPISIAQRENLTNPANPLHNTNIFQVKNSMGGNCKILAILIKFLNALFAYQLSILCLFNTKLQLMGQLSNWANSYFDKTQHVLSVPAHLIKTYWKFNKSLVGRKLRGSFHLILKYTPSIEEGNGWLIEIWRKHTKKRRSWLNPHCLQFGLLIPTKRSHLRFLFLVLSFSKLVCRCKQTTEIEKDSFCAGCWRVFAQAHVMLCSVVFLWWFLSCHQVKGQYTFEQICNQTNVPSVVNQITFSFSCRNVKIPLSTGDTLTI